MLYEVAQEAKPFNFYATGIEEILQNVRMLLTTPKGSVPLNRGFGLDMSSLDLPLEVAENIMTSEILEALQDYEPRVSLIKAVYEKNHESGRLNVKVRLKINDKDT